jgi:2-methylcitrate dehydratase PrpD
MTITDQLISFATKTVPTEAAAMMSLSVYDWAACGIAGTREADFHDFKNFQLRTGSGLCTVLGGGTATAATAALINGTLSHALDYDDTHFAHIGHPSVAVLPAIIALGQEVHADMEAVIDAATLGVEASILTGIWLGRSHYQVGYHQTATAGAFGATLAACRLLGLDKDEVRTALGLCASMASGIKEQFGTMAKPLNAGLAARSGVEAALWAQAGLTASADGLAGPLGFGPTHHGEDVDVALPKKIWHIQSISHKFHACCHGLHAMLEALGEGGLEPDNIDSLSIRTHPRWMSVCNIEAPKTGLEAKFSYRQTAAMTILGYDTAGIESYTDEITQDAAINTLRERIKVTEDTRLSETQSEITVHLHQGGLRRLKHDLMTPMSIEVRAAKLQAKACALVGKTQAEALWQAAQGETLSGLTDQLVIS